MKPWSYFDSLRRMRGPAAWIAYGIAAVALGAGGMYLTIGRLRGPAATQLEAAVQTDHGAPELEPIGTIRLSAEKQKTAGIRVEPARRGDFTKTVRVTGKVALNEDRVTHIHPLVEGRVHEVDVQFGDRVKAGQLLAVIDSRQVGRAKLELYQRIQETRLAKVNYDWAQQISRNTQALIADLEKQVPIADIDQRYPDKPMGQFRERLLSAYAALYKARADYKRLKGLSEQGVTAGKRFIDAEAARDASQATFSAALEQIKFTAQRDELSAKQNLERAQTAEAISHENLGILGYRHIKTEDIQPAVQGEKISHYQVKAPFDGTVISKTIVLLEQVNPSTQMLAIADFSSVWVTADIYENYLPLLSSLEGDTVPFHADAYPDRRFEAKVFYTGNIIGEKTRTADMRAIVKNPDGLLKPGMFVQIELPGTVVPDVIQVPRSAVVEEEGETFVFVQKNAKEFERRDVKVGRDSDDMVEIVAGLEPGEPVAVAGLFALKTAARGEISQED